MGRGGKREEQKRKEATSLVKQEESGKQGETHPCPSSSKTGLDKSPN